ncbi:MAG TPA: hypothetical protein VLB44_19415, partial [Kofleriaceae bacterium]|nr:hypothetical protein [Kofleriaceae bacterium]
AGLGVAAFGMVSPSKPATWQVHTNDVPHFSVEFPGEPHSISRGPSTELFLDNYEVLYGTLTTDEVTWLSKVIKPDAATETLQSTPHERYLRMRNGYVRAVVDRGTGYLIVSRGTGANAKRFTDSFHILE